MWNVEQAAKCLSTWAYSDSHVELDERVLMDILNADYEICGRLPTSEECREFVCGNDDGEVSEELIELFPQTNEFIESYWS